ncbi:MAG: glucose-1-phosphate cytidylyltransferase [Anaerolineales bacterium]|nr:glucose-1-phosphate cytidylyltransferase [Anaerolineae bacterium]PWB70370.1 MAG: glucose-1-phosphate cytidylyltransferase [Anaerolineales bacterium]
MKVVLFCGGLGTRLKEYSDTIPKPMVEIGYRPLMWHLMRYYAHFGHKEFILCLGYRGDYIKKYFLNYVEWLSNDFEMKKGGKEIKLFNNDIEDWTISFVDTGLQSNIGQRLVAVKDHLEGDEMFMANYTDGLCNLDLTWYLDQFYNNDKVGCFLSVKPSFTFHVVSSDETGQVRSIAPQTDAGIWINGGFFIFRKQVFNYIQEGEELVNEPFARLISEEKLMTHKHNGFFASIDTFREKVMFDEMFARGDTPWALWDANPRNARFRKNSNGK